MEVNFDLSNFERPICEDTKMKLFNQQENMTETRKNIKPKIKKVIK